MKKLEGTIKSAHAKISDVHTSTINNDLIADKEKSLRSFKSLSLKIVLKILYLQNQVKSRIL